MKSNYLKSLVEIANKRFSGIAQGAIHFQKNGKTYNVYAKSGDILYMMKGIELEYEKNFSIQADRLEIFLKGTKDEDIVIDPYDLKIKNENSDITLEFENVVPDDLFFEEDIKEIINKDYKLQPAMIPSFKILEKITKSLKHLNLGWEPIAMFRHENFIKISIKEFEFEFEYYICEDKKENKDEN